MSRTAPLTVTAALGDGTAEVAVRGEADAITAPTLEAMLSLALGRQPRELRLDLSRTSYLDCAAARVIALLTEITTSQAASRRGRRDA
jgi:anti-anti-sigma factor